jgi:endonuclease/exonuclease/phosphatase family metal-dependent hydrolase
MALLVRTWNVFHGNSSPPGRSCRLEAMVRLVSEDDPDVVCLQEVPAWAVKRLAGWSGMQAFAQVARHPLGPARLTGGVTRLHNGALRSLFAGQANAILVHPRHEARALGALGVSVWGREARAIHAVRVGELVLGNTHLSSPADSGVQERELQRCVAFLERFAPAGTPIVLAGDLNLLAPVVSGFSLGGPGIDHILSRGVASSGPVVWPAERRTLGRRLLSDHAPVEVRIG